MDKNQTEKITLGLIVAVIITIGLFAFVFKPNLRKIKERYRKIQEEKLNLQEAEETIAQITTIELNLQKLKEEIKDYQNNMPQATPDWLLRTLNSLAGETGINFDKIEPQGYLLAEAPYKLQGLDLELKTDYHRLGKFINKLENSSPFLTVMDLSIIGNKNDFTKHLIKLRVGAYVYIEE